MFRKRRLDSDGICRNCFATQLEEREKMHCTCKNRCCVHHTVMCSLAEQTGQRICEHGKGNSDRCLLQHWLVTTHTLIHTHTHTHTHTPSHICTQCVITKGSVVRANVHKTPTFTNTESHIHTHQSYTYTATQVTCFTTCISYSNYYC